MTANAVIDGTFADLKTVKTRSVVQLVIEVPIERAAQVVEMFGFPQPGSEIAVAVARLVTRAEPEKPRRKFSDLPRSQQAALKCEEPGFAEWLRGLRRDFAAEHLSAAEMVRRACRVKSRAEFDSDATVAERWDALLTEYEIATGRIPEPR